MRKRSVENEMTAGVDSPILSLYCSVTPVTGPGVTTNMMMHLLILCFLACVYIPSCTQALFFDKPWNDTYRGSLPCPIGWTQNRRTSTCYWFNNRNIVDADEADRKCSRWGGYLVTINDVTENEYIRSNFPIESNATGASEFAWMGLTNHLSKDFHWVENNRALDWEGLWAPGEPNDDGLLDASACGLLSAVDGLWRDDTCKSSRPGYGFICEKPVKKDPPPEPAPTEPDCGRRCQ